MFKMGRLMATNGIVIKMDESPKFEEFVRKSINRFINQDWGEISQDDKNLNDSAVKNKDDMILGAYEEDNTRIFIKTEWDRSVTTILFPDEY